MQASLERLRERREAGGEGGFTLIELLIVIVILAILAAIVVFAVDAMTGSSARASCESDVQTVDHAVQAYIGQVATTPTSITQLETATTGSDGSQVGPWLHSTPTNGKHYQIIIANGTKQFANYVTSPVSNAPAGSVVVESYDAAHTSFHGPYGPDSSTGGDATDTSPYPGTVFVTPTPAATITGTVSTPALACANIS